MIKKHWKRWLSVIVATLGMIGFVLIGAAEIFGAIELDMWGRLLGLIVQAACIFFGVNAGIKIKNDES